MSLHERHWESGESITVILQTLGDFWCEAAVLVEVFGLLDEILRHEALSLSWTMKTIACAIVLLLTGTVFRVWARHR
jgi:hypothetical protein